VRIGSIREIHLPVNRPKHDAGGARKESSFHPLTVRLTFFTLRHIPDPGSHCQRFYGAYSNRGRIVCAGRQADSRAAGAPSPGARENSDFSREARSTWARLVRKIFEADPLTCACGSSPLLPTPAWSTASCAIGRANAAGQKILQHRPVESKPRHPEAFLQSTTEIEYP